MNHEVFGLSLDWGIDMLHLKMFEMYSALEGMYVILKRHRHLFFKGLHATCMYYGVDSLPLSLWKRMELTTADWSPQRKSRNPLCESTFMT